MSWSRIEFAGLWWWWWCFDSLVLWLLFLGMLFVWEIELHFLWSAIIILEDAKFEFLLCWLFNVYKFLEAIREVRLFLLLSWVIVDWFCGIFIYMLLWDYGIALVERSLRILLIRKVMKIEVLKKLKFKIWNIKFFLSVW